MAIMRKDDAMEGAAIQVGQTHTVLGPESSFDGKLTFQGAVRIDGNKVTDKSLVCLPGTTHVYQVGKRRFARITIES